MRLGVKYVDKFSADRFALLLRIADAFQHFVKLLRCIDSADIEMKILFIHLERVFKFPRTQQTGVNEDTRLPSTDRLMNKGRCDGRVDTARQTADNVVGFAYGVSKRLD